jgi:hypothetical protein
MARLLGLLSLIASQLFRSRRDLFLENLALRQQLAVLKQQHPRPGLSLVCDVIGTALVRIRDPKIPFSQPRISPKAATKFKNQPRFTHGLSFGEGT